MDNRPVRVRFAPSPTGPLHIGGVRTALYNFLFARKNNGCFILRIEDTDRNRYVPGAEAYIMESFRWCGLQFDEGIREGGPYAPYRQSERTSLYRDFVNRLIETDHAYYAFDTPGELEKIREEWAASSKGQFQYDFKIRLRMKNSLSLSPEEVKERLAGGQAYVIRIRIPENEEVIFHDLIRGEVRVHTENLDDKVLFKSDGLPTYHLANVVDDYLMKVSHVIRGEEWLPSAPMHLLLYRFLGWEEVMPEFAHLPLILKPDGNGKLSKRDGDRLGFPVFPLEWRDPVTGEISHGYREDGYLPDAFINMLALLGWNAGTEQEIYTLNELVQAFSLERVGKHGSRFDPEKARWFNHQYIQAKSDTELVGYILPKASELCPRADADYCLEVIRLVKERAFLLTDLWLNSRFFFQRPESYDEQVRQKIWTPGTEELLSSFTGQVKKAGLFTKDMVHELVQNFVKENKIKTGQLMNPVRLLVVGSNQGPGMMEIAALLGKEEFVARLEEGLKKIEK